MDTTQILSILMTVLGIIMSVFGWFIIKVFNSVTDTIKTLNERIDKLDARINDLSSIISGLSAIQMAYKETNDEIKIKCVSRHADVNTRLNDHEKKIADHDTRITVIESKKK